jgi:Uma2 family endonuclease
MLDLGLGNRERGAVVADVLLAPWAEPAPPPYRGRLLTAADLGALPEDGWLYELVTGHLVRTPLPKERHGYVESEIGGTLRAYVKPRGLGRVYVGQTGFDLTLPDEPVATVLGADVAFLRAERVPSEEHDGDAYVPEPPDLVVDIASPSQFRPEMGAKAGLWLQRGARLVWVVWPTHRQVDVWTPRQEVPATLNIGDTLDGANVLPGFIYALADLFA